MHHGEWGLLYVQVRRVSRELECRCSGEGSDDDDDERKREHCGTSEIVERAKAWNERGGGVEDA